jgi:hypothetical protein
MRTKAWGGLITNASPFALPAGAAVEQVNLTTEIPGQITSRGGMRPLAFVGNNAPLLDIYPCEYDGKTYLVALTAAGELVALESPAYGEELEAPTEPQLTVASGESAASYTYRLLDSSVAGASSDPPPQPEPPSGYVVVLNGGTATTQQWPLYVDGVSLCAGAGKEDTFVGGTAATTQYPPSILVSQVCSTT